MVIGRKPGAHGRKGDKRRFLLGIGAQKCGTTWLHAYLAGHPETDFRSNIAKEYHVLDNHFHPATFTGQQRREERLARLGWQRPLAVALGTLGIARFGETASCQALVDMTADPRKYVRHFHRRPRGLLVGEITPTYMCLGAADFQEISEWLAPAFDLRVVFLMRDPVNRIESATRMYVNHGLLGLPATCEASFPLVKDDPHHLSRTRYDLALGALDAVFEPGQCFVAFYEQLFGPEGPRVMADLCDFLGIGYRTPDFARRVNASNGQLAGSFTAGQKAELRRKLDPVYRFCLDRFGNRFISNLWEHA